MVAAVIFDVGRVLIDWRPEAFYDARIGREARERLFAETGLLEAHIAVDRGEGSENVTRALARRHPEWRDEIHAWHDDWLGTVGPEIPGTADILRRLKSRGVPVMALTNFGRDTFDRTRPGYPVLDEFDRAFVSGDLGLVKPDPAIYAHVEHATGIPPSELFFTDDSPPNIEAARTRGWRTHLFRGAEGLEDALRDEGVLP